MAKSKKGNNPQEAIFDKALDKALKENFLKLFINAQRRILKFDFETIEPLSIDLPPLTLQRHADFVTKIRHRNGLVEVLHVEFQSSNDNKMVLRMQTYKALIQEHYQLPVRQYVLYLGRPKATMKSKLADYIAGETSDYAFTLESLNEYNLDEFIASDVPEEIILGLFANYHGRAPEAVIKQLIARLQQVCDNETKLGKYVYQLISTSRFIKLDEIIVNLIKDMALELDINIEEDALYKRGEARGEARGIAKIARSMLTQGEAIEKIMQYTGLSRTAIEQLSTD